MDAEELQRFRATWRQEVERRREPKRSEPADRAPAAPPSAAGAAERGVAKAPTPIAPPQRKDELEAILAPLIAAHEARIGKPYTAEVRTEEHAAEPASAGAAAPAEADEVDEAEGVANTLGGLALTEERVIRTVYAFHAADETRPVHVARLPREVWMHILSYVVAPRRAPAAQIELPAHAPVWRAYTGPDYISLENAGRSCWQLRLLTSDARLWHAVVRHTYMPPQVPWGDTLEEAFARQSLSWRNVYLRQPRLKLNGAYIAALQYVRQGQPEENVWVNVLHTVEYFRLLRFFPNGRCLSMLTSERPAQAVHQLEPGVRQKGLAAGHWRLVADDEGGGGTVVVEHLQDATLRNYTFQMTLRLRPSGAGRFHKLDMLEYASLNLHTGEVLPFAHRHAKPFVFSRVVSYGV